MKKMYLYTFPERLWHWLQAVLIILLLISGFNIHSSVRFFGFFTAFTIHNLCVWALIGLFAFSFFCHIVTGEWRQFIPTKEGIGEVIGIFILSLLALDPEVLFK